MNVKTVILVFLLGIGLLTGCSDDTDITPPAPSLNGTWHLKNLSGGIAGINEHYPNGTITWNFDSRNQTIIIVNNNQSSTRIIFDSGTYNYSIIEVNKQQYLQINSEEYGGLTLSTNNLLTIDQNEISWGVGADGFVLNFEK